MKKISLLKSIAMSVSALMVFSLSGCDFLSGLFGGDTPGGGPVQTEPELTISQTEISVAVGETVQLTATANEGAQVSWGTLNPSIATVVDGLVEGVAQGETLIWAETEALTKTCTVKVTAAQTPPDTETLTLSKTSLNMVVGDTATLTATCSIAGATIKWSSGVTSVATVSNSGKITALKSGFTQITATVDLPSGGKKTAICVVTVTNPAGSDKYGYTLVWNDEFNGTSLDTSKWNYQTGTQDVYGSATGPGYWGNGELQYYTQDAVSVSNGSLKITATKQSMGDRPYTSGRILTRDKASWTYGYFEAKMKTPTGDGMWPAFWMLPQPMNSNTLNNQYGGWPANGEIDIMEAKGRLYNQVDTTLHFGKAWDAHDYVGQVTTLLSNTDQWHTYAVDWTSDAITWYIDGKSVLTVDKYRWWSQDASNQGKSMPFDKPFYILFNLAVGGMYDNDVQPDYNSFVSATMEVDYVRVYKKS